MCVMFNAHFSQHSFWSANILYFSLSLSLSIFMKTMAMTSIIPMQQVSLKMTTFIAFNAYDKIDAAIVQLIISL